MAGSIDGFGNVGDNDYQSLHRGKGIIPAAYNHCNPRRGILQHTKRLNSKSKCIAHTCAVSSPNAAFAKPYALRGRKKQKHW